MNKKQHVFIWVGITLMTFIAILLDSSAFWLVAAMALIGESVLLCKNELSRWKLVLLCLVIVCFVVLFVSKDFRELSLQR